MMHRREVAADGSSNGEAMISYRTILVALDFSDCTQDLVDHAASLAGPLQARLILMHVAELPNGLEPDAKVAFGDGREQSAADLLVRSGEDRLRHYRAQLEPSGLVVDTLVVVGTTTDGIVEQAAAQDADLILMGTHGRRGVPRVLSGSIAAAVVARAPCPVLTVRTLHKTTCRAKSCDRCDSHITEELLQLMAERDG
jgi:nucleotide-binding universal stress UspA family protein